MLPCRHWEYDLKNLNILSVDTSDDMKSAIILAAIQVRCLMHTSVDTILNASECCCKHPVDSCNVAICLRMMKLCV